MRLCVEVVYDTLRTKTSLHFLGVHFCPRTIIVSPACVILLKSSALAIFLPKKLERRGTDQGLIFFIRCNLMKPTDSGAKDTMGDIIVNF